MTYEENVQRIAEEMATESHPKLFQATTMFAISEDNSGAWNRAIEDNKPQARIAIKRIAEAIIIFAYQSLESYHEIESFSNGASLIPYKGSVTEYLIINGLIPAQEGETNGTQQ